MTFPYAVNRSRSGLWRVLNVETGTTIFDTRSEAMARDHCADRNAMVSGRRGAPTIRCAICMDRGYFVDPDGGAPEPCSCRFPDGMADRVAYLDEVHRLAAKYR